MTRTPRHDLALGVQCFFTGLVALGAAFASYRHGLHFAMRFGADETTAWIWPLIVDGLLTIATVELWKADSGSKWQAWMAFTFGVSLSLCANIASAAELSAFGIMVAACPPLALLLAVELLNRALKRRRSAPQPPAEVLRDTAATELSAPPNVSGEQTAEQRMWEYYEAECRQGRTPTGADLDRVAGTHNYGRRILRKWRAADMSPRLSEPDAPRKPDARGAPEEQDGAVSARRPTNAPEAGQAARTPRQAGYGPGRLKARGSILAETARFARQPTTVSTTSVGSAAGQSRFERLHEDHHVHPEPFTST